jgi:hypothetical protein
MNSRHPLSKVKVSNFLFVEVKIMILKPPKKWHQETNHPETIIMRREKKVKEML